jgi:HD superfamily phosphohydrolase YqeK
MSAGDASATVVALPPWARVSDERRGHVERVGRLISQWADLMDVTAVERERWLRAVSIHDALKDAPRRQLLELAPEAWDDDSLRHGPAAAALAEREGERDQGVFGFAGWDDVGRMLYLADYLEPGRRGAGEERARRAALVPGNPAGVLREVAAERLGLTIAAGYPLLPETVDFWNGLTCDAS